METTTEAPEEQDAKILQFPTAAPEDTDTPEPLAPVEFTETIEQPDEASAEVAELIGNPPEHHAILEGWRAILSAAPAEGAKKIAPGWAMKIVSAHPQVKLSEIGLFRDIFFQKIAEMSKILDYEIASDDECLKRLTIESDKDENSVHYINVITNWQLQIAQWELDWDFAQPDAGVEIAAIAEIQSMFFSQIGITALLDNIGFDFTPADQEELTRQLDELRGEHE